MHFREILVKDVRLNVERTLGLARRIFLSILWGANFVYRYSEYFFFAEQLVAQFFLFFVGAWHFSVCATFQTCATFSRQTEEAGPRLPSYRPTSQTSTSTRHLTLNLPKVRILQCFTPSLWSLGLILAPMLPFLCLINYYHICMHPLFRFPLISMCFPASSTSLLWFCSHLPCPLVTTYTIL